MTFEDWMRGERVTYKPGDDSVEDRRLRRAWDAAVAAERDRCGVLTDDMLRYAMAAMGTGSPADADKFRLFWRFAIEARNTKA